MSVIRALKRDYGSCVKVVFHYFDAPRSALLEIQRARGISDDEIELRLTKTEGLYRIYAENGNITQKIKSSIALAELIVADLTYGRPNVYYDAFDKPLLLVAREGAEIHFDLAGESGRLKPPLNARPVGRTGIATPVRRGAMLS